MMKIDYILSFILFLFSIITLASCFYAIKQLINNFNKSIIWLIVFSFVVFVYCFSYSMELICTTLRVMVVFNTVKILAIAVSQSITLCMILALLYPAKKFKISFFVIIFIIPVITIVLRITSSYHTLYYHSFSITEGIFKTLKFKLGPWHYVYGIHGVSISLIAIGLLIKDFIVNIYRRERSILLIFAIMFPLTLGILTIMEVYVYEIILLPYAFPFTALCFYIAVFKHQLFNIIPLAYKRVFEWTDAGIVVMDNKLNVIGYNRSFNNIFPYIDISTCNYNIKELIKEYSQLEQTVFNDTESKIKVSNKDVDRYYTVDNAYLFDKKNAKTGQMLSFVDITQLAKVMSQLSELAFVDSLTGAYTRRYFDKHAKLELERAKRYAHPIALIVMDLDNFKSVNDKYGHLAGDKVLINIAILCNDLIKENDIFCRYGGEEFMLLLPETDAAGANVLAEKIRALIEAKEITFNNQKINITISLGYTGVSQVVDEELELLFKHADAALYIAKEKGRNRVQFLACEESTD